MRMTLTRLTAAATLAVGALLAALALAPAAGAAKLGGKTIVAPEPATIDALAAAGVTVTPAGAASVNGKGIGFPITGGKVNAETLQGKIEHEGGLTFSNAHESLTVENFTVKVGDKNVIRAEVAGGGKVRLAELDLDEAKIKQRGGKVVVSKVDVLLAKRAAAALSAVFGLPDLTGANIGDATVKVKT
jgi:Htaa